MRAGGAFSLLPSRYPNNSQPPCEQIPGFPPGSCRILKANVRLWHRSWCFISGEIINLGEGMDSFMQQQRQRAAGAGGITLALLLGLFVGPLLVYALAGDFWHTIGAPAPDRTPRIIAGVIGIALLIGALFNASRFRNAGLVGMLTGIGGGIGELTVAVVPWLAAPRFVHCQPGLICPLPSQPDLVNIALTAGIFFTVLFAVAGFSLAQLVSVVRHRLA
jgi:hypothetical protein